MTKNILFVAVYLICVIIKNKTIYKKVFKIIKTATFDCSPLTLPLWVMLVNQLGLQLTQQSPT